MDSAMDLSLRNSAPSPPVQIANPMNPVMSPSSPPPKVTGPPNTSAVQIVRPIPRPPWSIMWYQNLWSISSSPDQNRSNSESDCAGNGSGENSKAKIVFRSNERSSFSVLNNLSTNTVNNCVNNNNSCVLPYNMSNEEQQFQHLISDKCYTSTSASEPIHLEASTSSCKLKHVDLLSDYQRQRHFSSCQETTSRIDYSSDDDSDNSENIVVTTTSSFSKGIETKSLMKSPSICSLDKPESLSSSQHHQSSNPNIILDVACCDGPVQFKRVSNPNFALTVEHNEVCPPSFPDCKIPESPSNTAAQQQHTESYKVEQAATSSATDEGKRLQRRQHRPSTVEDEEFGNTTASTSTTVTTHKSYLCIYCNQSFKSLFCYQKHKKRHLNPVSVDITTTTANSTSYRSGGGVGSSQKKGNASGGVGGSTSTSAGGGGGGGNVGIIPENAKAKTKDLNVQFFPCKKCGCKFPSYYFVHKHRKICH